MARASYWTCQNCKDVFPVSHIVMIQRSTVHYELDGHPIETSYEVQCPICGSGDIEPAEYCEKCGEPCNPDYLEDGLCDVCRKEEQK